LNPQHKGKCHEKAVQAEGAGFLPGNDLRRVLLEGRRPELYRAVVVKTLAGRDFPDTLTDRMGFPR
jgi:hypothetical protein